jgi:hypothetical protein
MKDSRLRDLIRKLKRKLRPESEPPEDPYAYVGAPKKPRMPSPDFSYCFVARRVRRLWVRGARRSARGGILEQYVEHGDQAQRSRRGLITRRSRKGVRNAG